MLYIFFYQILLYKNIKKHQEGYQELMEIHLEFFAQKFVMQKV
jgi:hypothetical protein